MKNLNQIRNQFIYSTVTTIALFLATYHTKAQTWSPNGITVSGGNGKGSNANQLSSPVGIFVDKNKNIYVVDRDNHRVQKWGAPNYTTGITVAGGNGKGAAANQLDTPFDVFVDSFENVYVSDAGNNRVQKWVSPFNTGITVAGGNGLGANANQLHGATGLWVDNSNAIYVCDYMNHRVQKWEMPYTTGITVAGTGVQGSSANQLNRPVDVTIDASNNIYVSDEENDRVMKWVAPYVTGTLVAGGNGRGNAANQLSNPGNIQVDGGGNIFISDYFNHRVQKWSSPYNTGNTVAGGNGLGSSANQFNNTYGVAFGNDKNVYASDLNNHRVQRFDLIPTTTTNEEITLTEIDIYPNPTKGNLNFSGEATVTVANIMGQVVLEEKEVNSIDLSNQTSGIYFLTLYNQEGLILKRVKVMKE